MGDSRVQQFVPFAKDGTAIKTKVRGDSPEVDNDIWDQGTNYAGSDTVKKFKVNESDEIDVGGTLNAGSIEGPEDGGLITIFDMPFSAGASAGDLNGPYFKLDGDNMLYIIAEADGVGGSQNPKVVIDCGLNLKEITTPTAKADFGAVYTKSDNKMYFQDGAGVEHTVQLTNEAEGEMYIYDNAVATVVETANTPVMVRGIIAGNLSSFTFDAGSTGAITAFSDGTGKVNVASGTHGLETGDHISIRGTTNYNGIWEITKIDNDNFSIPDTWVANDGASDWDEGSHLIAGVGTAGNYTMNFQVSASEAGGAGSEVMCRVCINDVVCNKCTGERKFATNDLGNLPGTASLTIADGDRLYFTIQSTGTNDVTVKHGNLNLKR